MVDHVDNYHGTPVADPYRWLEDLDSPEVLQWAHAQQDITQTYLDKIPFTAKFEKSLTTKWNYARMSTPSHRGNRYFYYRNTGLQNHSVLYYKDGLNGEENILLDPNSFSEDGSASLSMTSISKDGNLIAYGISQSGSDWDEYFVKNIDTDEIYRDHLKWIKFSDASWLPDGSGFFYSRYPEPKGDAYEDANQFNKLYLHKIGNTQSEDELIYEDPNHPDYGFFSWITEDEQYQILGAWSGANDFNLLYFREFGSTDDFIPIIDKWLGDFSLIHNVGSTFYVKTKYNAPLGKIMKFEIGDDILDSWQEILPESNVVLRSAQIVNTDKLLVKYKRDLIDEVKIFDLNGSFNQDIKLPGMGSADFSGQWNDHKIFYSFTSFLSPKTIYTLDLTTFQTDVYWQSEFPFDNTLYNVEKVFYRSKDSTSVPMFILYKKGLDKNGQNPTYLYGYGGFNISLSPYFSVSRLPWLEVGGIIALPGIRGGGEYGEEWHQGGMLANKQNVFDDFITAGEYLVSRGFTSPEKLAIGGGSNGGLLVAACMLQRPDLFRAVDCSVPVADMLRYHKFTIGWAWVPEFGSADNPEQFPYLNAYSPVHNVKHEVNYPAIIISTADHDDRVVPSHSYKLAATLQAKNGGENPMLLRVNKKAGHGAGKPTKQIIHEIAEKWAFLMYEMGEVLN